LIASVGTNITRRQFLRGAFRQRDRHPRPPWALPEAEFLDRCDRCGACAKACPAGIIELSDSGYPRLDFHHSGCTFCGECVTACAPGALFRASDASNPWRLHAGVDESCLATRGVLCRLCGERCETGAIRFPPTLGAWPLPVFDLERCTGCGACVGACPAEAISLSEAAEMDWPVEAACT
jgi:ferredoxin-type protein NapF